MGCEQTSNFPLQTYRPRRDELPATSSCDWLVSLGGEDQPRARQSKQMSLPSHLHIGKVHAVEVTQHLVNL